MNLGEKKDFHIGTYIGQQVDQQEKAASLLLTCLNISIPSFEK